MKYYIALTQPTGLESVISYAKTQPDDPHTTLFRTSDVEEKMIQNVAAFLSQSVGAVRFKPTTVESFDDEKIGYLLSLVDGAEQVNNLAVYLVREIRVVQNRREDEVWVLGDGYDRKRGQLHMGVFRVPRKFDLETPEYVMPTRALYDGLSSGTLIGFGNGVVEPQQGRYAKMDTELSKVGVENFRSYLASCSDEEIESGFWGGLTDKGLNEFSNETTAGALMMDEWLIRKGVFDKLPERTANTEKNEYTDHLHRLASTRKS
jgi:hypothetical protein